MMENRRMEKNYDIAIKDKSFEEVFPILDGFIYFVAYF